MIKLKIITNDISSKKKIFNIEIYYWIVSKSHITVKSCHFRNKHSSDIRNLTEIQVKYDIIYVQNIVHCSKVQAIEYTKILNRYFDLNIKFYLQPKEKTNHKLCIM